MLRKKLCLALLWRRVRVTACVRANFLAAGAAGGAYRARRSALLAMLFTRASNNHLSRIGCGPGLSGGRPTAGPRRGIGGYNVLDRRVGLGPVRGRFGFRWLNRTHDPAELTVWTCGGVSMSQKEKCGGVSSVVYGGNSAQRNPQPQQIAVALWPLISITGPVFMEQLTRGIRPA